MSDEVERTLCQLPQCHVFKIPVRKSAEGHRASDWPQTPTWTGKLRIVALGKLAKINLIDDKNNLFASCPVTDDSAVERTLDSGRYFVLRLVNPQGQKAFIGIAFNERNDAFDFNVALSEHKSECERELAASKMSNAPITQIFQDLSIKEGEKIKINFGNKKEKNEKKTTSGGFMLPPPGSKLLAPTSNTLTVSDSNDSFDSFTSSNTTTTTNNNTNNFDSFDSFDSFGSSSDPFASSSNSNDLFSSTPTTIFNSAISATTSQLDEFGFPITSSSSYNSTNQSSNSNNLLDF